MISLNACSSVLRIIPYRLPAKAQGGHTGYRRKHKVFPANLSFLIFPVLLVTSVPPPSIWFAHMFPCNIASLFLGLVILLCIFDFGFLRKSHLDCGEMRWFFMKVLTPPETYFVQVFLSHELFVHATLQVFFRQFPTLVMDIS